MLAQTSSTREGPERSIRRPRTGAMHASPAR
jgi:hypothetical protein